MSEGQGFAGKLCPVSTASHSGQVRKVNGLQRLMDEKLLTKK